MIINTPSNPTGALFDEAILRDIAQIAIENNVIILSD
jgi:aspartate/methionine/tyrosine aminotransferase